MAFNQRIIPRRPRDPGAAQVSVDHDRRLRKLESTTGVIGGGATITGPLIETSDTGSRVYIQGEPAGTPGLFGTDSLGNVVIGLMPGTGLMLNVGTVGGDGSTGISPNNIEWVDDIASATPVVFAQVGGIAPLFGHGKAWMQGIYPGGDTCYFEVASGATLATARIWGDVAGKQVLICDGNGNGQWPGGIGMYGKTPPSSQPFTPATLSEVISLLQIYGMCP